ncbi:MAG TPA: deoxyhypusine synthase family protein [Planctomycetota bacterium]|jgi:deoxyhypusine synthase
MKPRKHKALRPAKSGTQSKEFFHAKSARIGDKNNPYLQGRRLRPSAITGREPIGELIDNAFLAYNGGRLREACEVFTRKMLAPEATVGMTLSGALTPAGLGCSCIIPLIKAGFVDWIISTGANLYHDLHFAFNLPLHAGSPHIPDTELHRRRVVRIYDIYMHYDDVLLATDALLREILVQPEFQKEMGTAECHYALGKYAAEYEKQMGLKDASVLAAAYRAGVPIFTSSPGDSTIGMNIAGLALRGNKLKIDPTLDVNQTAAIVLGAKRGRVARAGRTTSVCGADCPCKNAPVHGQSAGAKGRSSGLPVPHNGKGTHGALIIGGGSPKNFMLQTEPQIQEILAIDEAGQDYFLQITDARPDTGGLSGATPSEAVTWNKVDPQKLPDMLVCYLDSTVALPLLTSYALARHKPRPLKRLYDRLGDLLQGLETEAQSTLLRRKPVSGAS